MRDIAKRTIWCLKAGKMLDECIIDDTPDDCLHRKLDKVTDIRVEVEVKGSLDLFKSIGSDIVELYSQPRVAQEATAKRREGVDLIPGWSFDLTKADPQTGKPWDLSNDNIQSRVKKIIAESRPLFVIGSPPCIPFSVLQNINKGRRCPKVVAQELDLGKKNIKFCIGIYKAQMKEGRFFIHEHPKSATSWSMPEIVEVLAVPGVDVAEVDLCAYGLKTVKNGKEGPAKKPTIIASNSKEVLKRIARKCPGCHDHISLDEGRAKRAQVYPQMFCEKICEGIAAQKQLMRCGLEAVPMMDLSEMSEVAASAGDYDDECGLSPSDSLHEPDPNGMEAFDDQTGGVLKPELVRKARGEEIEYFKSMKVYTKVKVEECIAETGRKPIQVRWIDINKGDSQAPNYRRRLVAK